MISGATLKNGDPEAAVRRDGVGTATERALTVELFGDPGHGDQRDGGGDEIELQVTQPRQVLQIGIAQEVDRHQANNDLVHGRLLTLLIAYSINRRVHGFCNGHLPELETASHSFRYAERVLGRS